MKLEGNLPVRIANFACEAEFVCRIYSNKISNASWQKRRFELVEVACGLIYCARQEKKRKKELTNFEQCRSVQEVCNKIKLDVGQKPFEIQISGKIC